MQPGRHDVGKPRGLPSDPMMPRAAEATPVEAGSDEDSWESLGSTRVTDGNTPPRQLRPDATENDVDTAPVPRGGAKEPARLGDYQLIKKVGEGAMGAVYKARQLSFARDVALKVLFPHIAKNPKLVERLHREGLVMGRLDHPNIVQAYGVDEDQDWHYIALEFVDGQSMHRWLEALGRIPLGDALHIVIACARALEYAHGQGVVHRDIKPDNILIDKSGTVKVADLGMVKVDDDEELMALTQTGHAVGTPWYMPLEQAKNAKETDGRSDIYALGCMLYCFVTGTPPFAGKTLLEVIRAKEIGTFPPARQLNADVPERLDLIITKMTAKLPKYRYQNCTELIKDLESLQLASSRLTFLDPKSAARGPEPTPAPPSSHDDLHPCVVVDPNVWYVRTREADGRRTLQKLTTAEVVKMLSENTLAPNNKASHDEKQGFRALATYKEFQSSAMAMASKTSADEKSVRYRTLYKKIEAQAKQREDDLLPKRVETNPWKPLAIKFGLSAVGIVLVILFFWWLAH